MLKPISKIASNVCASTTLEIDALYKNMKLQGIDVVGFGAGEPDFNTPQNIKTAGIDAIEKNMTRYTPASGTIELKKAICHILERDMNVCYNPSQIVVASGAKHNVFLTCATLLDPGDEVIIPAPFWVSYKEIVSMVGGIPVILTTREEDNFKITPQDLENAITDKTKMIMINSPSNPTGILYTGKELLEISKICVKHGIYIMSDEIYYNLVYDNTEFVSVASLGEDIKHHTILINGVSKSYSMTGWRIGYAAANEEVSKAMSNYVSHSTSAPSTISQYAAREALMGSQESVVIMRNEFQKRRDFFLSRVSSIDGISCVRPQGAFYILMNISSFVGKNMHGTIIRGSDDFARLFLEKGLVATVPCSGFGADNYLRWSYAVSMEDIGRGLDRLEDFIRG